MRKTLPSIFESYLTGLLNTLLIVGCLVGFAPRACWALVYCNVTDIQVKAMPNGVQVTVVADGVLEWEYPREMYNKRYDKVMRIALRLENARSKIDKNFIPVNETPLSHVEISVPQNAEEGIGLDIAATLTEASAFDVDLSRDKQALIITVNSDRTIERVGHGERVAASQENGGQQCVVTFEQGLLSVHAVNGDIHQVMGAIAWESGAEIAVDDEIGVYLERMSLSLPKMPVDTVIRAIASAYGLALEKVGEVYMISAGLPASLATYNRSGTRSFPMRYLQAQNASGLLPTFLYSYLHVNEEQNAVVVTAPRQMLDKIGTDLGKTDVAPPQIMIEAVAVEVTTTEDFNLGLSARYRDMHNDIAGDTTTGDLSYRSLSSEDFVEGGQYYEATVPTQDLSVRLNAMLEKGKAEIKARPQMAVVNGQLAEIFIGAQRFVQVSFLQYGQQQERILTVPVGVRLRVIPWTGGNNEITTDIEAEVSNIVSIDSETGIPRLSSRNVETTVRVRDGETIVIGGLTLDQETTRRRKIPLLGDLPIVGRVFRSRTNTSTKTELVLFITPHLLREGHLPDDRENAIKQRFLNGHLEKSK